MKKFILSFLILIIIGFSFGGYLFIKKEQNKMYNLFFNGPLFHVFRFDNPEFVDFYLTFYQTLGIKKSFNEVLNHHVCVFKDEVLAQNKKTFVFDQNQLEKSFEMNCPRHVFWIDNKPYYRNAYMFCNEKKECRSSVANFDSFYVFDTKEVFELIGNVFEKRDYNTFFKEKLNIDNPHNKLFFAMGSSGLGNLLFQQWGAYIYAQKKGLELESLLPRKIHDIFEFEKPRPEVKNFKNIAAPCEYWKRIINFNADSIVFSQNPVSVLNFKGYEKFIIENTKFKEPLTGKSNEIAEKMKNEVSVSIHVRRGDFISRGYRLLKLSYYQNAVKYMKEKFENPHFYVFSDDINWAKENLKLDANITFVDWTTKDYEDMHLMTKTKHSIISNSSFSWWGAFLNENKDKIVLIPETGFYNEGVAHTKVADNWIIIKE